MLHYVHALDNVAKDYVSAVQPGSLHGGDEELGSVGVGASVSHGEDTRSGMLEDEILVGKLLSVDGLASSAIMVGEVTPLQHEVWDDTVEGGASVAEALFTCAERTEVFACFRSDVRS